MLHPSESPLPARQGHRNDAYLVGQQRCAVYDANAFKVKNKHPAKSVCLFHKMRTYQPTKYNCLDSEPLDFVPDQATLDGLPTLFRPASIRAAFPCTGTPIPR